MDKSTHEIRLAHWKQIIEQCQSRPKSQTASVTAGVFMTATGAKEKEDGYSFK